jgi:hypothetical protein
MFILSISNLNELFSSLICSNVSFVALTFSLVTEEDSNANIQNIGKQITPMIRDL